MPDEHPIVEQECPRKEETDAFYDEGLCATCRVEPCPFGHDPPPPIVEQPDRPDWLWEMPRSMLPGTPEARRKIMDYIEFLERELAGHGLMRKGYIDELSKYSLETATLTNELHQAKAIIEGLTAERDRAEKGLDERDRDLERLYSRIKELETA